MNSMRIETVESNLYRVPLPEVLSDSTHGEISKFELVTVRVVTQSGLEGLGYTYTVGAGGTGVRALLRELVRVLAGADARRIERLWSDMWWRLHWVGRGGAAVLAISAVDIALWDLAGKRQGEPLWRLLGGHSDRVPAYVGGVDLNDPLEALCERAGTAVERGFSAVKMKVGRERLQEDVERVRAVREAVGSDTRLMVDANMRWRVDEAIRAARLLREMDVFWLEEPTRPDDVAGHVRIAHEGGLPIAAGENLHTADEFLSLMASGALSFAEPDVANIGGVSAWMRIARLAEAHNLPVTSHGVHDLHVHLLAAVPNSSFLEVHGFGLERFMTGSLEIGDGVAVAPDRPGHGVALIWDSLEEHRVAG